MPSVLTLEVFDAAGTLLSRASAFFVTRDVVATSYHALKDGRSAYARTIDGAYNFTVVGAAAVDREADVALLELRGADGRPLPVSERDTYEPGEKVFVFGSPKGLEGSVTTGIVSSASLRVFAGGEYLQISAPISPGSSGGPVVNGRGEVIGVAARSLDGAQNLNFAVPARTLRQLVAKIGSPVIAIASLPHGEATALTARSKGEPESCGDSPFTLPAGRKASFYIHAGERLYDERRYSEAKEAYKRAIDLDPENAWAHFALAHIYLRLGCEQKAVIANRQAIILEPGEMKYRDGLGWVLLQMGRYSEAAEVYEEALRMDAKQALARTRLGMCYVQLGRVAEAIKAFEDAIRLDAKCALARFWLGKTYAERLGNREGALEQQRILQKQDAALAEELERILHTPLP
jgi:Tfp pilus assembly protein PilF